MADIFPEVMSVPVLSTAHITRLDHDLLEAHIDIDRHTREDSTWSTDWKSPLVVLSDNEYGYWIYCGHEGLIADENGTAYICEEMEKAGFSHSLIEILIAGKEAGHAYVRLDCDGSVSESFPTYGWSMTRPQNVEILAKQIKAMMAIGGRAVPKSTTLLASDGLFRRRQALLAGLILGLTPRLDANADEILRASEIVGMPWTYKDMPRLFVLASKADLVPDDVFYIFNPETGEFVSEHADGKGTA